MYAKYQRSLKYDPIRIVEAMFYLRDEIEQAVAEMRNSCGGKSGGAQSGHARISDPTANTAIRAAEEIRQVTLDGGEVVRWPERWLRVFAETYQFCNDEKKKFINLRYKEKERYYRVIQILNISQATYYLFLGEVRNFGLAAACQLGLVHVI